LVLLLVLGAPLLAQSERRAGLFPREQRASAQVTAGAAGALAGPAHTASQTGSYGDCTRVAYQAWADGNWELYAARGDGTSPQRLTTNAVADEAPSLSADGRMLAFQSSRDGNEEIYTMRADGSQVSRVTAFAARDVLPSLSPDATRIAFQGYRHGAQPEVYLTAATGGAPRALTDNAVYDGQPRWSPDGARIVFVSARSGAFNVWVMDADGTHARQVTTLPYCGAPTWSPDGSQIAFACDDLDTGFTALWVVNSDGSAPHLVHRPATAQTDAWPGSWSPDGRYVIFERATWQFSDGEWRISAVSIEKVAPAQPADRESLPTGPMSLAPSWVAHDETPPTSQVNPLAAISARRVQVSWIGTDACSPSIEYQVQYRIAGAIAWTDWETTPGQTWTHATRATLEWDVPGARIALRVRARDAQGNVEPWPEGNGDATTSFPAAISGLVRDCRDTAIPGAVVAGPAPTQPSIATTRGSYALLATGESPFAVNVSAPGFASTLHTWPAFDDASGIDEYLTTEPEWVANGGFEAGQVGWYTLGDVTFEESPYGYGQRVALLGAGASAPATVPAAAHPRLWQVISIPAQAQQPTLSFVYALGKGEDPGDAALLVSLATGGAEVELARAAGPTTWHNTAQGAVYPVWQHAWVDLTPWAGQTVTLTFTLIPRSAGDVVQLDQVSVAAWRMPRVDVCAPTRAAPRTAVTVDLYGENLLPGATVSLGDLNLATTYVSSTHVQAVVPANTPAGRYDLWVANPGGYRAALPEAFTIGYLAQLPFIAGD
jgi:dipeptidyl aminopeptidase/acylaminoacyl peptidase